MLPSKSKYLLPSPLKKVKIYKNAYEADCYFDGRNLVLAEALTEESKEEIIKNWKEIHRQKTRQN